jgi:glucose-6-phosphate 1-epimerase
MSTGTVIESLNQKFGKEGAVRFEAGQGGLTRAVITSPRGVAHVYLHGAHVTHYQPQGQAPLLFVSEKSWFEVGKPIRGGIPICFPWFGDAGTPAHGFARLVEWSVHDVTISPEHDVTLTLELLTKGPAVARSLWAHEARVWYHVRVGAHLKLSLEVKNIGAKPFAFEEALHTYLAVGDIERVAVRGLRGVEYLDKTLQFEMVTQETDPLTFTGETDRIYFDTRAACRMDDSHNHPARQVTVAKLGSADTVVWNPWIAKAKEMPDYGDQEWRRMLCIETANVREHAIKLNPGETHKMYAELSSELAG